MVIKYVISFQDQELLHHFDINPEKNLENRLKNNAEIMNNAKIISIATYLSPDAGLIQSLVSFSDQGEGFFLR